MCFLSSLISNFYSLYIFIYIILNIGEPPPNFAAWPRGDKSKRELHPQNDRARSPEARKLEKRPPS